MNQLQKPIFLDCQSTGASPQTSLLLELACNNQAWVICQPEAVSARVLKLIGITPEEVAAGISCDQVFQILRGEIVETEATFAVAHFARFEKTYLDRLWQEHAGTNFPVPLVCTHQIAKRLFPKLPSYGLRALAGWFGTPLPSGKRAAAHVQATAMIWEHLVRKLNDRGILTVQQILELCSQKAAKTKGPKEFLIPREKRLGLPRSPGIYRYLDRSGRVLYVGKTTSLKQRVNSYFTGGCRGDHRKLEMLTQAVDFEIEALETPLEAGLREYDEIRRLSPPYNIAFTGQGYNPIDALRILMDPPGTQAYATIWPEVREIFFGLEDAEALRTGLGLWRTASQISESTVLTQRQLINMGIPLLREWIAQEKKRLAEKAARSATGESMSQEEQDEESEMDDEEDKDEEFVWSAELIAAACPSLLRRATRHYLRQKWWRRVAQATIRFTSPNRSKAGSRAGASHGSPVCKEISFRINELEPSDEQRIRILLHELRRAEAKGGDWQVVAPWPMKVPFWI